MHLSPKLFKVSAKVLDHAFLGMLRLVHYLFYFFEVTDRCANWARTAAALPTAGLASARFLRTRLFDVAQEISHDALDTFFVTVHGRRRGLYLQLLLVNNLVTNCLLLRGRWAELACLALTVFRRWQAHGACRALRVFWLHFWSRYIAHRVVYVVDAEFHVAADQMLSFALISVEHAHYIVSHSFYAARPLWAGTAAAYFHVWRLTTIHTFNEWAVCSR